MSASTGTASLAAGPAAPTACAQDDFDRNVWCVLGLPVDVCDLAGAVAAIDAAARERRRLSFVTPNVNWLVRALKDDAARGQIVRADLSLVDGAPLALIARLLGVPQKARVAGSDLFEALRARAGKPLRVFFFGGREGSAEAAAAAVAAAPGGLDAAGWLNPGYGDVETMSTDNIVAAVNAAAPDFVVVSLGAAKGQAWIERNRARLEAPVIAHLGAVVDFTAGAVARAPRWATRAGLEWAWRIYAEPALWRRYASDGLALAGLAVRRLAPQFAAGRGRAKRPASADAVREAAGLRLRLAGDLVADGLAPNGLAPVREAFRRAAKTADAVALDFAGVGAMDRAFLGLLLMLEKHVVARGRMLTIENLPPRHRRLFTANSLHYPSRRDADAAP